MEGFFSLAMANNCLIILIHIIMYQMLYFSDSPTYLEIKSEEETEKKVPSVSVAQALAK